MRYWIHRITRWALLLAVLLVALLILFRIRYHQVITDLSKTQIINSTSDLINDAVAAQIARRAET
jgi:Na+-driven multidrug efflux pump